MLVLPQNGLDSPGEGRAADTKEGQRKRNI